MTRRLQSEESLILFYYCISAQVLHRNSLQVNLDALVVGIRA
jgi:hypothetical protein